MYRLPYFTEADQTRVIAFMKSYPFIVLTGSKNGRSVATQVPVLAEERESGLFLRGHVMRQTDHHLAFEENPGVLALFTGPQCYVSAGWYSKRGEGGTWNYMTVHARGKIKLLGEGETLQLLTDLTNQYEADQAQPELVENMSSHYLRTNIKAIAGFEIAVEELYPIFKLSQNKDDETYKNIVTKLQQTGKRNEQEIAEEMKQRRPNLF